MNATEKQISFINTLLIERDTHGTIFEGHVIAPSGLNGPAASEAISALLALPKANNGEPSVVYSVPLDGIYFYENTYYKVQTSPESGKQYAKRCDEGSWIYEGRKPFAFLRPSHAVTAEDAAKFGHLYGMCVFCSKTLTDERSIEVGYGPTCASHNGLPWGAK
jgi:hypothetical protein